MKIYKIAATLSLFTLMACDRGPNFAELCEQHSEICEEFESDSWCKRERIKVGFANISEKLKPNDDNKFQQLIAYENYKTCMAHASKIEHIKLKEKKTRRINNVLKAQDKIEKISNATANSEHPDLLYYHWSRYLDQSALDKFIALEGNKILEKPNRQVNLASYYIKRDPNKTLDLLYHALTLYPSDAKIDTEIFKSIASIFSEKEEYKQAYIWSKILHLYQPDDENLTVDTLNNYIALYNLDSEYLDRVAKTTLNKIVTGQFKAPQT